MQPPLSRMGLRVSVRRELEAASAAMGTIGAGWVFVADASCARRGGAEWLAGGYDRGCMDDDGGLK